MRGYEQEQGYDWRCLAFSGVRRFDAAFSLLPLCLSASLECGGLMPLSTFLPLCLSGVKKAASKRRTPEREVGGVKTPHSSDG
jgi:hypothetical protein